MGGIERREIVGQLRLAGLRVDRQHRNRPGHRLVRVKNHAHRETEFARKVEVALVVGRHRHDRTVTVVGQHVVRGPDRNAFTVDRVHREPVEEHTGFLPAGVLALDLRGLLHLHEVVREALAHGIR